MNGDSTYQKLVLARNQLTLLSSAATSVLAAFAPDDQEDKRAAARLRMELRVTENILIATRDYSEKRDLTGKKPSRKRKKPLAGL